MLKLVSERKSAERCILMHTNVRCDLLECRGMYRKGKYFTTAVQILHTDVPQMQVLYASKALYLAMRYQQLHTTIVADTSSPRETRSGATQKIENTSRPLARLRRPRRLKKENSHLIHRNRHEPRAIATSLTKYMQT